MFPFNVSNLDTKPLGCYLTIGMPILKKTVKRGSYRFNHFKCAQYLDHNSFMSFAYENSDQKANGGSMYFQWRFSHRLETIKNRKNLMTRDCRFKCSSPVI